MGRPVNAGARPVLLAAALVSAFTTLVVGPPARADGNSDDADAPARRALDRAKAQYAAGAFARARALLRQARAKTKHPALLGQVHFHLGLAHAADNQLDQARTAFRAALTHDPSLRIDPHRYKPALVEAFEATRRALAASVLRSQRVRPAPSTRARVETSVASPRTDRQHQATVTPAGTGDATKPDGKGDVEVRRGKLRWTWVGAAATVALAALAVGFGLAALDDRNEGCSLLTDKALPCEQRQSLVSAPSEQRYLELRDSVATKRAVSNIAWAATGVAAAATAVLMLVERRARRRRDTAASATLLPGGAGLTLRIGF